MTGLAFLDLDEQLTKAEGKTPRELFDLYGEEHFRNLEHDCLLKALTAENAVISCGGGIVLREENRRALEKEQVVWIVRSLDAALSNPAVLMRPPVNGSRENYRSLYRARRRLYAGCAQTVIENADSASCARALAKMYGYVK